MTTTVLRAEIMNFSQIKLNQMQTSASFQHRIWSHTVFQSSNKNHASVNIDRSRECNIIALFFSARESLGQLPTFLRQ